MTAMRQRVAEENHEQAMARHMAILGTCAGLMGKYLDVTSTAVRRRTEWSYGEIRRSLAWLKANDLLSTVRKSNDDDWLYAVTLRGWDACGVQRPMGVGE